MSYQVIGRVTDVAILLRHSSALSLSDVDRILHSRQFRRWYRHNQRAVGVLAAAAPIVAFKMFHPSTVMAATDAASQAAAATGAFGFFTGQGIILLHVLIVGFLTLLVTTFLKFTGRGDLAPLVVFIGGGVILHETVGLFNSIYHDVAMFLRS